MTGSFENKCVEKLKAALQKEELESSIKKVCSYEDVSENIFFIDGWYISIVSDPENDTVMLWWGNGSKEPLPLPRPKNYLSFERVAYSSTNDQLEAFVEETIRYMKNPALKDNFIVRAAKKMLSKI